MKVIILKENKNLGEVGSIIEVKDGYAKNYLIPQGIVAFGTKEKIILAKKKITKKKRKNC